MSIELEDYETQVNLRPWRMEDFDALVALQLRCFPTMKPWKRDQVESMLNEFPDGQLLIELEGEVVASASGLIVDYSDYSDWHDWGSVSDGGYIRNHDENGDTLYGIEIMVDPAHRGHRFARRLYEARKQLCRERNLARMLIGGRIPGYVTYKDELTPHEYVDRVMARELFDPVLTAQLANGFVLKEIISDYLPSDEDSAGYATFLEWPNLEYVRGKKRFRRAVDPVRVSSVQYQMREIETFEEFARQCEFFVDTAADAKVDFVVFPELFTLQLLSLVEERMTPGQGARSLARFTPQYLELFMHLAVRYNVNIVGGSHFIVDDDGKLRNVAYFFRRDGMLFSQPKLHPTPNERRWWGVEGGKGLEVIETDRGKIAILICYDVEFPELARVAIDKGANLLFVPYNTNDRLGHIRVRTCAQARCIENSIYVVTAGCVGNLPFVDNADTHYAQSGIFTPSDVGFARDGVASEAPANVETVLVQDLDLQLLRRHRKSGAVRTWEDRRRDLYRVTWLGDDEPREV